MVVSVSLSGVSASYSGIDGAGQEREIGLEEYRYQMPLTHPLDPSLAEQR